MLNEKGQVILLLIVIMTVALAVGLSIVQRSLIDVSTASRVEQSSRAFSAAEAGIEKAISSDSPVDLFPLDNNSKISGVDKSVVPAPGQALEYPPLSKEEVAQVWLADPDTLTPTYTASSLDVYWGNSPTDQAAIELTLVYYDGAKYASRKWYLDQTSRGNSFEVVSTCAGGYSPSGSSTQYRCKKTLGDDSGVNNGPLPSGLMLIRVRLLYNNTSQPFAVQARGTCGSNCSLPPQARLFTSTGSSGETQRKIQVFQLYKVVPPYFDYGIFSAGEINK